MTTTTIGSNPVTNNWVWDGVEPMTRVRVGSYFTADLGRMVQADFFAARVNAGGSGGATAWRSGVVQFEVTSEGFTLGNTGAVNAAQADASCSWHTATGDIPTTSGQDWQFGGNNSSALYVPCRTGSPDSTNVTAGVSFTTWFGTGGSLHGYGTYFIITIYEKVAGSWVKKFLRKKGVAGSSTLPKSYKKVGGGWTQVGHLAEDIAFDPVEQVEIMFENEEGIFVPGLLMFEGPYYLGSEESINFHKRGRLFVPRSYELVAA